MTIVTHARRQVLYCRDGQRSTPEPGRLIIGDARTALCTIPAASIDCVITSPPYFLLRNYGHADQLGLERSVDDWVIGIRDIMREITRVLTPTGGVWLNVGDSYSRGNRYGAPPKSLLLGPERLLLQLFDDGWIVRNKIVWAKPNPMPASVRDRLTCAWEPMYFLVRSPTYYFDLDAVREPHVSRTPRKRPTRPGKYESSHGAWAGPLAGINDGLQRTRQEGRAGHPLGKNPTDVWRLATATFGGAHFAVYPETLIERPLRLSCPERVCTACGRPWQREQRRNRLGDMRPDCDCQASWRAGVVLDPFMGSGTTAIVAERLGRHWLGIEINPNYAAMARRRIDAARGRDEAPRSAATEIAA